MRKKRLLLHLANAFLILGALLLTGTLSYFGWQRWDEIRQVRALEARLARVQARIGGPTSHIEGEKGEAPNSTADTRPSVTELPATPLPPPPTASPAQRHRATVTVPRPSPTLTPTPTTSPPSSQPRRSPTPRPVQEGPDPDPPASTSPSPAPASRLSTSGRNASGESAAAAGGASTAARPTPVSSPRSYSPPVRLFIPALGIDTPVVPVSIKLIEKDGTLAATWQSADYAAGYHEGTAYPGEPGNLVLSGHNNIKGRVFRPISLLGYDSVPFPKGALAYVVTEDGRTYAYAFQEKHLLKEKGVPWKQRLENARFLAPTTEPVLTLITCWPLNNNTHRVIVRATLAGEVKVNTLRMK